MRRPPKKKPNTIQLNYAKTACDGPDYFVSWGEGVTSGAANLVLRTISDLGKRLGEAGFDVTTIKFEIKKHDASSSVQTLPPAPKREPAQRGAQ